MSIEAWPFLISRNKILDYSVIVAPDFIVRDDYSKLISLTDGVMTEVDTWRIMNDARGRILTLVFRIEPAEIEGDRARDGFGRLIVWVSGFVLNGAEKEVPVTEEVFKAVNESVCQSYWEFWSRSEHMSVVPSDPLYLCLDGGSARSALFSREAQVTSRPPASNYSLEVKITELMKTLAAKFVTFFSSR